jgi:cyclopropane-fatty-acyl-phospholipid synthase
MKKNDEVAPPAWLDRFMARQIARPLADLAVKTRIWDGSSVGGPIGNPADDPVAGAVGSPANGPADSPTAGSVADPAREPRATFAFRNRRALLRCLFDPGLGLPDCYVDGSLEIDGDLLAVLESSNRRSAPGGRLRRRWWQHLPTRGKPIGPEDARRNAQAHYDLPAEFFRLWLDPAMTYTCAYFATTEATLEQAQRAKMDYVCRKLGLTGGERVVEAGCGWGGLALHMAERYGARVSAFNVSLAQLEYAREQARSRGLDGQVEFVEADYRSIQGSFDVFVSVGMLETVGLTHYAELGRVIKRCLASGGRGLVHSIGRSQPFPTDRWIARRIFPGSYYPSLSEITRVFEPNDLVVTDVENLRMHYARTLEHWQAAYERAAARVADMFTPEFERMWRLYLTAALAAFRTGWMQLYQVVFTHTENAAPPRRYR